MKITRVMSSLWDEIDDINVFAEDIEPHMQGKSESYQVITLPRESSLTVRKPTKRRLVSSKTIKSPSNIAFVDSYWINNCRKRSKYSPYQY